MQQQCQMLSRLHLFLQVAKTPTQTGSLFARAAQIVGFVATGPT
jgi:hypothetical protein